MLTPEDDVALVSDGCDICRNPVIADHICARCRETLPDAEKAYARLDSHPIDD